MPTHAVRFYTAQVLLGLDALHSNGYVYRCGTRLRRVCRLRETLTPARCASQRFEA